MARYRKKESTHLPPEAEAEASERALEHVVYNAAVEDAAQRLSEQSGNVATSMTDLLLRAQLCRDVSEAAKQSHLQRALAGALLDRGWQQRRPVVNGSRNRLWYPPSMLRPVPDDSCGTA